MAERLPIHPLPHLIRSADPTTDGVQPAGTERQRSLGRPDTLDYAALSDPALVVVAGKELLRLLLADVGHTAIQGWLVAVQLWAFLHRWPDEDEDDGEDAGLFGLDWDPDPRGVSPTVDRLEGDALAKTRAIRKEMTRRRTGPQERRA